MKTSKSLCLFFFSMIIGSASYSQTQPNPNLYATIYTLDSAMFDAYNKCDLVKFEAFFADDVEFYHDKGGVMTDKESILLASKNNVCGKVARQLVKESFEVWPINNYGAILTGTHRFKNYGAGDTEFGKPARFLHIWQFKDGLWKITRVVSYDHN